MIKISKSEQIAQKIIIILLVLFGILTIFPFVNAFAYALSDPVEASKGVSIFPRKLTLMNFEIVFQRPDILPAYGISILRTILGIVYHIVICSFASYALSRESLPFNKTITIFTIIPMYIGAGIVASYVTIYKLGLINNFWVYIIPHAFGAYNMLVMRTYFQGIPESMRESALMDGASETRIFVQIIAPLSTPVLAVIALWQGVWQWNSWFDAMLYVPKVKLHPLAMLLRRVISENEIMQTGLIDASATVSTMYSPQSLRMAMLVIATLPIVMVYPFLQKYFVKGVMIGAVKG